MSALLERLLVAFAVAASCAYALRALAPFRWRVGLARRLAGRVPDRLRIWIAGRGACETCSPGRPRR
jgi:hypothetical protein